MKAVIILNFLAIGGAHNLSSSGASPRWGCGLLGGIPGIQQDGTTTAETQKMVDGLKVTSSFGKIHYWNWNLAPETDIVSGDTQHLSKDFIFMPEQWGAQAVVAKYVREGGVANFLDGNGKVCPASMATIFLGANEPDMTGSCMGNMMGRCTAPCTGGEVNAGNCPVGHLHDLTPAQPNSAGHCDCWSDDVATSAGFWSVQGCSAYQPLPTMWQDSGCVSSVMGFWKQTAATVTAKGYLYLSTPLLAVNMDWLETFVSHACNGCSSPSCGCPTHVGWHFYAEDCRPKSLGGYADFQNKLDKTVAIMEKFPHLEGAIINEVGMLNCNTGGSQSNPCIPNGPTQKYPAIKQPNHACPANDEMPNGMASFIKELLTMVTKAKTSDGRAAVAAFSWFNENMAGGTYNLRLFDDSGNVNDVGDAYIAACQAWASGVPPSPSPPGPAPPPSPSPPTPTPPTPPGPAPPAPTPSPPAPTPPSPPTPATCKVGDVVSCPHSSAKCAGSQCCPDLSICPSAVNTFTGCQKAKDTDCTTHGAASTSFLITDVVV